MKKIILLIIILNINSNSFGIEPPTGEMVTDPQSYLHLIDQIALAQERVDAAKKQIEEAKALTEVVSEARTAMFTAYNNTFGIVGQLNDLKESIQGVPESLQKFGDKVLQYTNCIAEDIGDYKKIDMLLTAKYYRKTPTDHPFNFSSGTVGETGEPVSDLFGSNSFEQHEERPCGLVITFGKILEDKQNAFNLVKTETEKHVKKYTSEDAIKKNAQKIKKLISEIERPNQSLTEIQSLSRDILVQISLDLRDIKKLLFLMANHQLENQPPVVPNITLSDEQQENLNSLDDKEIYETNNINKLLKEINNNHSNEGIDTLPF